TPSPASPAACSSGETRVHHRGTESTEDHRGKAKDSSRWSSVLSVPLWLIHPGCAAGIILPGRPLLKSLPSLTPSNWSRTLRVAAGTYTFTPSAVTADLQALGSDQVLTILDKRLAVYGGYTTADAFATANPKANPTVIDGQGQVRALMVIGQTKPAAIDLE